MKTRIPVFDYTPGLPIDQLHAEIDVANTVTALGKRKLARCLCDMQERGVFALSGHGSAAHYACARLGMDQRRAQEFVRIGRQLEELPDLDAALVSGDLSWSKMRILLRVVVPDTQLDWLERAEESNCSTLSSDVTRCSPGDRPKERNGGGLTDIRMTVRASLLLVNHELWEQARRKLSAEMKLTVTNEDMMIQVARFILSTDAEGKVGGRTEVKHSPFQLMVHQTAIRDGEARTVVHTEHGDVELREDHAARLAAQAEIVPAARTVADPDGETPAWLANRVLARDNKICRNCGRAWHLQVHHVEFRSRGGKTEEDGLASVCTACHSLIHNGLLRMQGDGTGGFVFVAGQSGELVEQESTPISAATVEHAVLGGVPRSRLSRALSLVRMRRELAPSSEMPWMRTQVRVPPRARNREPSSSVDAV